MAPQPEPPLLNPSVARRRSWLVKAACIGVLLIVLQAPVILTEGVLRERQNYRSQAIADVTGVWGKEQRVTGPVLAVPYVYRGTRTQAMLVNGQTVQMEEPVNFAATAYFLPDVLHVEAEVDPEVRQRGIYDVVVYNCRLKLTGRMRPDFAAAGIEADRIDWTKARLLVGLSDLHGLRSISALRRGDGTPSAFESTDAAAASFLPLAVDPGLAGPGATVDFAIDALLQGSGTITVAPVGKTTTAAMKSPWASPSFTGAWLPTVREVTPAGFKAEWSVAHFSRGFPQHWTSRHIAAPEMREKIEAAAFGVRLAGGVDGYGVVHRAQKYAVLFFVLVFAVFFLFEIVSGLRIHPLQYGIAGAALGLFFLGFLALTEIWDTAAAYGVTATVCTAMVSLYAWTFLNSGWRTLIVGGGLAATYGYLFFVLKSEDYALLAGTSALFAVLALIMFFTRRINWYAVDAGAVPAAAPR